MDNIALIHNNLWVKGARILLINEVFHIINNYTAMEKVGYFVKYVRGFGFCIVHFYLFFPYVWCIMETESYWARSEQ